jgi:hypothetical protein
MPTIHLDIPEDTLQKLDMETDLLGFDDLQSYLTWIIGNRAAIEQGTERDQLLTEYAARVSELESELQEQSTGGTGERVVPASGDDTATSDLGGNFRPERVERVSDDSVEEVANVLGGVEGERLDEFARMAVAKTRKQLGRDPTTGLTYRSRTSISRESGTGVAPGSDITTLDEVDVPGRSAETVESRRRAVGAALAYLRDVGEARRSDFVAELYEEFSAEYGSETGWWNCIKTGLKQVDLVDGGDGSRVWRYRRTELSNEAGTLRGPGPRRIVDSR